MATRNMVHGSGHDLSLGKKQDNAYLQSQDYILNEDDHDVVNGDGLLLGESHVVDLPIPHSYKIKLAVPHRQGHLDSTRDPRHHLTISEIDERGARPLQMYSPACDQEDGFNRDDEVMDEGNHGASDHASDGDSPENNDDQLAVTVASRNSDLPDGHNFDGSIELQVDHNHERGIVPVAESDDQVSEFVISSPSIVQSRALAIAPDHELHVGQEFPDVRSCRRALRDTAIALHFEIQTVKSDKTRFTAKCASEGCPWRIHAAKLPGVPTFTIRTINNNHSCNGINHLGHQQATVQWVANSVEQKLRENPNCKPKEILEEIHRVHGIALSYKQAWRGKERIMAAVRGSFEEGYRILPDYIEQIKQTNPSSIAAVYGNPEDNSFERLFVSYQASIYGFLNGCRPLLGLDRITLKSKYLGTLLLAAGFDGDGALFPLAFGVVDEENDENWMWFLSEFRNLLEFNTENMPMLTILSDRHKGIVDGVEANFPTAFHGFCMQHLSESFRKEFNNVTLVNLFWEAAHALTMLEFEQKIFDIERISADAAYWIRRIPPRLWATAYFEGKRFGHLTANVVESINPWLAEASSLPIVQMMESIRRQLMTWFNERREMSMQWESTLVPSAQKQVEEALELAQSFHVLRANDAEMEVISNDDGTNVVSNIVDIRNRCCSCRGWQAYGLPCSHAVAALRSCRQNVQRFAETYFTVATYRKAYSQTIHPIPDKTMWKESARVLAIEDGSNSNNSTEIIMKPPKSLRPPPRPRKRRVRSEEQGLVKRVVHCSRCNETGHFRTTCTAPI